MAEIKSVAEKPPLTFLEQIQQRQKEMSKIFLPIVAVIMALILLGRLEHYRKVTDHETTIVRSAAWVPLLFFLFGLLTIGLAWALRSHLGRFATTCLMIGGLVAALWMAPTRFAQTVRVDDKELQYSPDFLSRQVIKWNDIEKKGIQVRLVTHVSGRLKSITTTHHLDFFHDT